MSHCRVVAERALDGEDVIYEVELKRGVAYKDLLERLTKAIHPESINVLVGEGNVNA